MTNDEAKLYLENALSGFNQKDKAPFFLMNTEQKWKLKSNTKGYHKNYKI